MILLYLASSAYAGQILYPGFGTITFNDKYSYKDFTGKTLLSATDLEGITIYGSCFSQETPDTQVFPNNLIKITFVNCNLDNVFLVKPGWIIVGGTQRRFKVQNDLRDWEIDTNGIPVKVLNEEYWMINRFSVNPADIPLTKLKDISEIKKVQVIE